MCDISFIKNYFTRESPHEWMKAYLLNLKIGRRKLKLHVMIIPPNDSFLYQRYFLCKLYKRFTKKNSPVIEVTSRIGECCIRNSEDTHWKGFKF